MQYHPSGEPQSLEIIDIEPLEETASGSPEWSCAFWENLSAEQYAERQGGRPIEQAGSLYGAGDADDQFHFQIRGLQRQLCRTACR